MATATRGLQSIAGGTANFNGQDAGGLMSANIDAGFDNIINPTHDGLIFPIPEKLIPYVRFSVQSQDVEQAIAVFNGASDDYTFYTKETGLASYDMQVLLFPQIHSLDINLVNNGYSSCSWSAECKPVDGTKTHKDMWASTINTEKPAFLSSNRAVKIVSVVGTSTITHVMGVTFSLNATLLRESMDGALGYTQIEMENYTAGGSVTFQDTTVATSTLLAVKLLNDAVANLTITMKDSGLAGTATYVIKNVTYTNITTNRDDSGNYVSHTANFIVSDNSGTPVTAANVIAIT